MWPQNLHDAWLLSLPTLVPYMILMSLKMMERKTPFTSETFLHEYDYIVGKFITDCRFTPVWFVRSSRRS